MISFLYKYTLSLTSALGGVGGQQHALAAILPGKWKEALFLTEAIPLYIINCHHHHHHHHHYVPEGLGMFLFLDPQDEVGPSISSSVVLCFFVLFVSIVVLVLVVCLCYQLYNILYTVSTHQYIITVTLGYWYIDRILLF